MYGGESVQSTNTFLIKSNAIWHRAWSRDTDAGRLAAQAYEQDIFDIICAETILVGVRITKEMQPCIYSLQM